MAQGWSKLFTRINWKNRPSTATALNETNLNKSDYALDKIDDRVITLDTTKADISVVNEMVSDIDIDETTGIITVTYKNGSTKTFDTNLEKIAVNFDFDKNTQQLILVMPDGTRQYIDLSAFITQYEFSDSDTIAFSVNSSGTISAIIKSGSVTDDMIESGYLANIKIEAGKAKTYSENAYLSQQNAEIDATNAQSYAIGGTGSRDGEDTDNAKYYKEQAQEILNTMQEGQVTGVKGANETAFRRGDVNITADDIGALATDGDSKSNTVTFTSYDASDESATSWTNVNTLESGITHATFFQRVSQMFKNVRYLYKMLGSTDISGIGDGTVTGGLNTLNSNLSKKAESSHTHNNLYYTETEIDNKFKGLYLSCLNGICDTKSSTSNANNAKYIFSGQMNMSNCPTAYPILITLPYDASGTYMAQICFNVTTASEMWFRTKVNGTWNKWYKITATVTS